MEKRVWTHPLTSVEQFAANEYVAACGDQNKVYKFVCDSSTALGEAFDTSYNVYLNGADGIAGTDDDIALATRWGNSQFTGYHPCGETHEASVTDDFLNGYMFVQGNLTGLDIGNRRDVIVWTDGGTNVHCTTNLNMDSWTTDKS